MRIVATDAFLNEIEKSIKNAKEDMSKVNYEQDKISDADEALEHAKAYWMMGYTWEEIEAILEDMEYPDKIVDGAIKKTQEYAQETLGEGPFKLKEGQLIKLSNGEVVKVINFSDKIARTLTSKGDLFNVSVKLIDIENSKKLTEAFNLREGAKKLIKEAQRDPSKPTSLVPMDVRMEPKRVETTDVRYTPTLQAPGGWAPYFDEFPLEDIPEASGKVKEHMKEIEQLIGLMDAFEEELKEAEDSIKETKDKIAKLKGERGQTKALLGEEGKAIASILGFEASFSNDLVPHTVKRFSNLLVAYREEMGKPDLRVPGPVDKFDAIINIITEKAPDIIGDIMTTLSEWTDANSYIIEKLHKDVAIKEIKEKDINKKRSQIIEKMGEWLFSLWDKVKATYTKLTQESLPELDELSDLLEGGLADMEQEQLAASVHTALKSYIK